MNIKKAATDTIELLGRYNNYSKEARRDEFNPESMEHVLWLLKGIEMGYIEHEKAHRWLSWSQAMIFVRFDDVKLSDFKEINKNS